MLNTQVKTVKQCIHCHKLEDGNKWVNISKIRNSNLVKHLLSKQVSFQGIVCPSCALRQYKGFIAKLCKNALAD